MLLMFQKSKHFHDQENYPFVLFTYIVYYSLVSKPRNRWKCVMKKITSENVLKNVRAIEWIRMCAQACNISISQFIL